MRDLLLGERPAMSVWVKHVWRCRHAACPKQTWTKTNEAIAPRASLTQRARAEICRRVGQDAASIAAVARDFGIGWRTVMATDREYGHCGSRSAISSDTSPVRVTRYSSACLSSSSRPRHGAERVGQP